MEMTVKDLRVDRLLLFMWLCTASDPSEDEWNAALNAMGKQQATEGVSLDDVRMLIVTDGGAPNGVQRARVTREFACKGCVITTVLSNPIKRGIATALAWLNPKILFCEPNAAACGLAHLDLENRWPGLEPSFSEMQRTLPRNRTLELVKSTLDLPDQH